MNCFRFRVQTFFLVTYQTHAFHACFRVLNHSVFFLSPGFLLVVICCTPPEEAGQQVTSGKARDAELA